MGSDGAANKHTAAVCSKQMRRQEQLAPAAAVKAVKVKRL
jgi:hypothetical protein